MSLQAREDEIALYRFQRALSLLPYPSKLTITPRVQKLTIDMGDKGIETFQGEESIAKRLQEIWNKEIEKEIESVKTQGRPSLAGSS